MTVPTVWCLHLAGGMPMSRPPTLWSIAGAMTLVALAFVVIVVRSAAPPPAVEVKLPEPAVSDGVLKVYVSGAVARPGIYQLRPGDRHADALAAAGGPTDDADTLTVNMARRARDEEQIHVPRKGDPPLSLSSTSAVGGATLIDLNTASQAQLESLPGIGAVRAQKIIESRTKDGAFVRADDLVQRKLVPQSMLESIRELLLIRQ